MSLGQLFSDMGKAYIEGQKIEEEMITVTKCCKEEPVNIGNWDMILSQCEECGTIEPDTEEMPVSTWENL